MARKHKHPEHVNMERWLISYADFITLLFILFIILFSFSQIDIAKYKKVAGSLASEFSGGGNPIMEFKGEGFGEENNETGSSSDTDSFETLGKSPSQIEDETLANLAESIHDYGQEKGIDTNISFKNDERGLHISITGTVLYNDASASLTPQSKEFINVIFEKLKTLSNQILIEGHTDNRPIRTTEFPSNWELSAARSINLVRYLIEEYGFDPHRLSSAAYGEYRPIATNDTPSGQAENRRVEIIIIKEALP